MDTISIGDLKHLGSVKGAAAVSIYLPTNLAPDTRQDAIRLKDLLDRAEDELEARGMQRVEAQELLKPARKLTSKDEFWKRLNQGLAIFVSPGLFRAYRLPLAFDESLTVKCRFNIKPLLPIADYGERFLLLALSQNHSRLFDVTRSGIKEIATDAFPESKRQALNYDGADPGEQVHAGMRGSFGKRAGVFHGQGGIKDTAKGDLEQFFHIINRALAPLLRNESAPLLLAGVDYLLPIFRKTSSYAHIVERHLTGNCDLMTADQLKQRSWEIMRPYFDRPRRVAFEKLHALLGTGKASADVVDVAGAATTGKIDALLVIAGQKQLGKFDEKLAKFQVCACAGDTGEDLINLAVAETLQHGGVVYSAETRQLPDGTAVAAIYRY